MGDRSCLGVHVSDGLQSLRNRQRQYRLGRRGLLSDDLESRPTCELCGTALLDDPRSSLYAGWVCLPCHRYIAGQEIDVFDRSPAHALAIQRKED